MGVGWPVVGEGWCRMEIGDEGAPQGVVRAREATWVKCGSSLRPVPPITAMRTGSGRGLSWRYFAKDTFFSRQMSLYLYTHWICLPSSYDSVKQTLIASRQRHELVS